MLGQFRGIGTDHRCEACRGTGRRPDAPEVQRLQWYAGLVWLAKHGEGAAMEESIAAEKIKAATLRRCAADAAEESYWLGYRIGLTARSEHHEALLSGIGSPDAMRDASGRGYRDGRQFAEGRQP